VTSTTDEVLSGLNLQGKRILVTGVSAGLGLETPRSLAAPGADVVGAARDLKKENCHVSEVVADSAAIRAAGKGVRGYALDPNNAEALWKKSEEMVGERP